MNDDPTATRSLHHSAESGERGRSYLLVVEGASSSRFDLPRDGVLMVGRCEECDLRLEDPSVSRRHARFMVTNGEARVVDLDSHNGTKVNGERIEGARAVSSGDVVALGEITLVVSAARRGQQRTILDLPQLRARVDEEIERALGYRRPLALCAVELGAGGDRVAAARAASRELRVIDIAGFGSEAQLFVVMPELERSAASRSVSRMLSAMEQAAPQARAGLATSPADGCDADSLLGAARAAAAQATPGRIADAVEAATTMMIGDREVVVADPAMLRIFELIRRLAQSDLPVLIVGETGAGKENAAFAVHAWSKREAKPLVTLNCAAIPDNLVESELFGHEKGAFSGAEKQKPGLLETAHGGTVFLDEVGELAAATQAKLLRAIEAKKITRVGAVQEREVDIRIVAATNRDLQADVKTGKFRQDLYFRLGAATVILPPLRDRPRELALLARTFLERACLASSRETMKIAPQAMHLMARYAWPGNVRELKNVMEYAAATVLDDTIEAGHLPPTILGDTPPPAAAPPPPTPAPDGGSSFRPLSDELRDLERQRMAEALAAAGGVQTRAAELIGMPLRTFVQKLKQYDLKGR